MPPEMLKFVDDIYIVAAAAAAVAAVVVLHAIAVADLQLPLAFVLIVVLLDGNHAAAAADLSRGCLYTRNFDGIDPRIKSHHHKRKYCYRDNHCFYGSCVVSRLHLLRRT